MEDLLDMFEISAKSKDGHDYLVELAAHPSKIVESFNTHMANIGWDQVQYKITKYKKVESKHIEVEYDTDNG